VKESALESRSTLSLAPENVKWHVKRRLPLPLSLHPLMMAFCHTLLELLPLSWSFLVYALLDLMIFKSLFMS